MKRFVVGLAIALCSCTRPLPPEAVCGFYQLDGQRETWRELPVQLYVGLPVPAYALLALDAAIAEYNTHGLGGREIFRIVRYGLVGESGGVDGYNVIGWQDSWDSSRSTEARTRTGMSGDEIIDADVFVNAFNFNFDITSPHYSNVDLESLFVHELGHVLGLKHIDTVGSVMNPILVPGQVRRTLGAIDQADLSCGYEGL